MKSGRTLAFGLVLAAALVPARAAHALDPERPLSAYATTAWSTRAGLPGSWVRAIAQTADGYLWIATYGGLGRYDGARIVTLPTAPPWNHLGDVVNLKLDGAGVLWAVPSLGPPICVRESVPSRCLPAGAALPANVRLTDVQLDADGTVWLAARQGLWRFTPPGTLAAVPVPSFERSSFLQRDRQGRLWMGTTSGLLLVRPEGAALYHGFGAATDGGVFALAEDARGVLWFSVERGLLRVEGETATLLEAPARQPYQRPSPVLVDGDSNVWLGGVEGLGRLHDGRFAAFSGADGLPDDEVTALFEDREGSLWVGMRSGGLAQFNDRTVTAGAGPASLQHGPQVETVCEDAEGALWVGSSAGLVRMHEGGERLYTEKDGLPGTKVLAATPGRAGDLWVGTTAGLGRIAGGRAEAVPGVKGNVDALYLDAQGRLWMDLDHSVAVLEGDHLTRVPRADGQALGSIRGMGHDDQGTLWVAAVSGVGRVQNGTLVDAGLPRAVQTSRALHRDPTGALWISTNAGLLRVSGGAARLIGPGEGVATPQLFQMLNDEGGDLWVGTGGGIMRLARSELGELVAGRRARLRPVTLDVTDQRREVAATTFRQPGAWRDHRGRLWFASHRGLMTVDPRRVRVNNQAPAIRIDDALVDGRAMRPGGDNQFPPGPGNLEFRYSAVTLLEPHKSLYRYRLEGFDEDWVDAGPRRVAYYTNMQPGRYRFRVLGSNADGVWNEAGAAVEFRLRPHLYRTPWFYGGCGVLLLSTLVLLHRARVAGVRRAYLAVFAERSRVARELHDTLLQGMSAAMLQIRGLRRRLMREAPAVATELEGIETLVGGSLREARGVLGELREASAGGGDLGVALTRMAGRVREGHEVRCEVSVEGRPVRLPQQLEGELFRIGQEALINALKHAGAGRIELRLSYEKDQVRLTVADDGRGFDEQSAPGATRGHFGLLGMRERASRVGTFKLDSRPGAGTRIEVTAPLAEGARPDA